MMHPKLTVVSSLALAAVLWTAGVSEAGHGGGGGGGHGGGGHGGGGHMGGYGGHGGYHGGYGGYHGGYRGGYGYGGYGFGGYGYGLGYGGLYGGLGYPGYGYGSYGTGYSSLYNSPANAYPSYNTAPVYPYTNPDSYDPYQGTVAIPSTSVNRSLYYSPPQPTDNTARIRVLVPSSAKVWLADEETTLTGGDRTFASPELEPGKHYAYRVKAQWMQDGKPVERVQRVQVEANQTSTVDFTKPDLSQH